MGGKDCLRGPGPGRKGKGEKVDGEATVVLPSRQHSLTIPVLAALIFQTSCLLLYTRILYCFTYSCRSVYCYNSRPHFVLRFAQGIMAAV